MTRSYQGFTLDRFQEEALNAIDAGQDVVVAAPTGCGKTLVAEYAVQKALEAGRRVFYTGPIKALSNQKFRDFTKRFGEEKVGIVTGDVSINPHASIVIMTTEIFRNSLFDGRGGRREELAWVIFDEVHYLG
ncbi:MAG: DEAD/DEAH box helicase, partial [Planctomycetota bacterium]